MKALYYNFRLGPEAIWLVVNTIIGTVLVQVLADLMNWGSVVPPLTDLKAWAVGLGIGAVRTGIGALLAVATGGGFQGPGDPKPPAV